MRAGSGWRITIGAVGEAVPQYRHPDGPDAAVRELAQVILQVVPPPAVPLAVRARHAPVGWRASEVPAERRASLAICAPGVVDRNVHALPGKRVAGVDERVLEEQPGNERMPERVVLAGPVA